MSVLRGIIVLSKWMFQSVSPLVYNLMVILVASWLELVFLSKRVSFTPNSGVRDFPDKVKKQLVCMSVQVI